MLSGSDRVRPSRRGHFVLGRSAEQFGGRWIETTAGVIASGPAVADSESMVAVLSSSQVGG